MTIICPTITAFDTHEYQAQMQLVKPFAQRLHIDLMDGVFAPTKSPDISDIWWFDQLTADIHLMYQNPEEVIDQVINKHPSMVVFHAEANIDHVELARKLRDNNVRAGLAIMQATEVEPLIDMLEAFDHALIFSGDLGHHGGVADLSLLDKVTQIKNRFPRIEIGWDGGISEDNAPALVTAGVNVLNVGGYIHKAENPEEAYAKLELLTRTI